MDQKDLCEHTRIRLIAAAIGHQQCTKTAASLVPLADGRVVAIGTPADVARLLPATTAAQPLDLDKLEALARQAETDITACARFTTTFDPAGVLALIAQARAAQPAGAADTTASASIDTPEFRDFIDAMLNEYWEPERHRAALIAYIDGRATLAPVAAQQAAAKAPAAQAAEMSKAIRELPRPDLRHHDEYRRGFSHALTDVLALIAASPASTPEASQQAAAVAAPSDEQDSGAAMHDVVFMLREYAASPGYSHNDYADTMREAANCIEMLRARFWNSDHLAAPATAGPATTDPIGWLPNTALAELRKEVPYKYESGVNAHIYRQAAADCIPIYSGAATTEDLAAKFNAAVDAEYPLPDSPHASVIQRATDNRAAMWRGITAARKILGAATTSEDARDAARYRYMRNEAWGCGKQGYPDVHVCQFGPGVLKSAITELAEEALDAAIDAAMRATQQEGGK